MKKAGIWIDHRQAFLVFISAYAESSERIESGMQKQTRYYGSSAMVMMRLLRYNDYN
jgi:hypothetical protein